MSLTGPKTVALLPQLYACVIFFFHSFNKIDCLRGSEGHTVWENDHVSNEANPYLSVWPSENRKRDSWA